MKNDNKIFIVRDFRNREHLTVVDDIYLNGYARKIGPIGTSVYLLLARHANNEQISWPSQVTISTKLGISIKSVQRSIVLLSKLHIIKTIRRGKMENNEYILLDKSQWKVMRLKDLSLDSDTSSGPVSDTSSGPVKKGIDIYLPKGGKLVKEEDTKVHTTDKSVVVQDKNPIFTEAQEIVGYFSGQYAKKISIDGKFPIIDWNRSIGKAKKFIRQFTVKELKDLVDCYFEDQDKFYEKTAWSIDVFFMASTLNKLIQYKK